MEIGLLNVFRLYWQGHQRMASSVAWAEDPTYNCNLFSAGFDRRVLGWSICLPKENQQ